MKDISGNPILCSKCGSDNLRISDKEPSPGTSIYKSYLTCDTCKHRKVIEVTSIPIPANTILTKSHPFKDKLSGNKGGKKRYFEGLK